MAASAVQALDGRIHERTRAQSFDRKSRWQVILATHMPVETPIDGLA